MYILGKKSQEMKHGVNSPPPILFKEYFTPILKGPTTSLLLLHRTKYTFLLPLDIYSNATLTYRIFSIS